MREVLEGSVPGRPPGEELDRLLWEHTLAPMVGLVNATMSERLDAVGAYPISEVTAS
jgi:hypothetical protein